MSNLNGEQRLSKDGKTVITEEKVIGADNPKEVINEENSAKEKRTKMVVRFTHGEDKFQTHRRADFIIGYLPQTIRVTEKQRALIKKDVTIYEVTAGRGLIQAKDNETKENEEPKMKPKKVVNHFKKAEKDFKNGTTDSFKKSKK